jgi:hypothetical protein
MLNLTDAVSPARFPEQFSEYPRNKDPNDMSLKYMLPLFFQFSCFRDLKLAYLIGIGIDKIQVENLILDFLNLYLVAMYIFHFKNPLLMKQMQKVFWVFPHPSDKPQKWDRLVPSVKK